MSIYHRIVLRFQNLPLPGRLSVCRVWVKGFSEPFYVRLGTTDWYVLEEIFLDEVYQPIINDPPEKVRQIVDLGANTGFSIRLWQQNFPSALIVAVEPDEANMRMCRKNILPDTEGTRTQLVQACVAAAPRRVSLDRSGGAWGFIMRDAAAEEAETVEARTLPQIMAECGREGPIDLLKCNIEGAEREVFAYCGDWIGRVRRLAVQVHLPYTPEKFLEDLSSSGARLTTYHSMDYADGSKLLFMEQSVQPTP